MKFEFKNYCKGKSDIEMLFDEDKLIVGFIYLIKL